MAFSVAAIGQIAIGSAMSTGGDLLRRRAGLRRLFRFGDLCFFDCAGVRLMVEKSAEPGKSASVIYFRCPDIVLARRSLEARGVVFVDQPHLIAPMEDHDCG